MIDTDELGPWYRTLFKARAAATQVLVGPGDDDCGAVEMPGTILVATMDFLNATPIVSQLSVGGPYEKGRVAVGANLSDLLGSGATPLALLLGIMADRTMESGELEALCSGVAFEAERWGIPVIGGDTKLGRETTIVAAALGYAADPQQLFLLDHCAAGQDLYVSGALGGCAAAVMDLSMEQPFAADVAKSRITEPNLPMELSAAVARLRLAGGGTDISDGLSADLHTMCAASHVGAELWFESLPVDEYAEKVAQRHEIAPGVMALVLGGDFQFLLTASPSNSERVLQLGMKRIGRITTGQQLTLRMGDRRVPLPNFGHRDVRNLTFTEEVTRLVGEASRLLR